VIFQDFPISDFPRKSAKFAI